MTGAMHSTPFTADQIRDATPSGRTYEYLVETAGAPKIVHVMRFEQVSLEGAELHVEMRDPLGKRLSSPPSRRILWEELRKQAEFPKERVAVSEKRIHSIIHPLMADHMVREGLRFLEDLKVAV